MSITVRVKILSGSDATLKVLRFAENMSVLEACKTIAQKINGDASSGADHGLYQPPNEEEVKGGKWLRSDRTLGHYEIKNNVLLTK